MDRAASDQTIKTCLAEIHSRLSEAARISTAAKRAGWPGTGEAVTISMDIQQLIYEAGRLHDAASLLDRLAQQ
jgi:hypothetical protein